MSDQVTAPDADDRVWARSRATGRFKQMSRAKLAILAHGWEDSGAPGSGDEVVAPLSSSTTEEHPDRVGVDDKPALADPAPAPQRAPRVVPQKES